MMGAQRCQSVWRRACPVPHDNCKEVVPCRISRTVLPISGAFGDLNEAQAARAAALLHAQHTLPCPSWNFAEHSGNPQRFAEAMRAAGLVVYPAAYGRLSGRIEQP